MDFLKQVKPKKMIITSTAKSSIAEEYALAKALWGFENLWLHNAVQIRRFNSLLLRAIKPLNKNKQTETHKIYNRSTLLQELHPLSSTAIIHYEEKAYNIKSNTSHTHTVFSSLCQYNPKNDAPNTKKTGATANTCHSVSFNHWLLDSVKFFRRQ